LRPEQPSPYVLAIDHNKLAAAVAQPRQTFRGAELYPGMFQKAAVLARGIIAHCFGDGNKRAGMVAADVFLGVNGIELRPGRRAFVDLGLRIDIKKPSIREIAQTLASWVTPAELQLSLPFAEDEEL
jgi:death-on-curing protein